MQPQNYERAKNNSFFGYEGKPWRINDGFPTVSNQCINEANTVKHCLLNNKLSVIDNAKTWESVCATDRFYGACRGKEQLHMVEEMWIE